MPEKQRSWACRPRAAGGAVNSFFAHAMSA